MEETQSVPGKYVLSKYYVWGTIGSLIALSIYYIYKFNKYYDPNHVFDFNILSAVCFFLSIILILLLLYKFNLKSKALYLFLFFLIGSATIISYYFIKPVKCSDCEGNIIVAERLRETGPANFFKNFHKPTLYTINNSPIKRARFLGYDNLLRLNYKEQLAGIEKESPDVTLSNHKRLGVINFRISKHSPLWFCTIGLWQSFFGDSNFSHVMLANLMTVMYLASLYVLLGIFLKEDEYREKLLILLLVMLLPIFLTISGLITNDMVVGIFVLWTIFFLMKEKNENISCNDFLAGVIYSLAVLFKFTMLPLFLAVILFYVINYKFNNALPKIIVFCISFTLFPLLLNVIFGYDMILNIITAATEEYVIIAARKRSVISKIILWYGMHESYMFGVPLILLILTHMLKVRQYLARNEVLTSYVYIVFLIMIGVLFRYSYWSRILVGYLPLMVPLLVSIYNNCHEKKRMILTTCLFLSINNFLVLINDLIIAMILHPSYAANDSFIV